MVCVVQDIGELTSSMELAAAAAAQAGGANATAAVTGGERDSEGEGREGLRERREVGLSGTDAEAAARGEEEREEGERGARARGLLIRTRAGAAHMDADRGLLRAWEAEVQANAWQGEGDRPRRRGAFDVRGLG